MQKAEDPNNMDSEDRFSNSRGKAIRIRGKYGVNVSYKSSLNARIYNTLQPLWSRILAMALFHDFEVRETKPYSSLYIAGFEMITLKTEQMNEYLKLKFTVNNDFENDLVKLWRRNVLVATSQRDDVIHALIKTCHESSAVIETLSKNIGFKHLHTTPLEILAKYIRLSHNLFQDNHQYLSLLVSLVDQVTYTNHNDPYYYGKQIQEIPKELFEKVKAMYPDSGVSDINNIYQRTRILRKKAKNNQEVMWDSAVDTLLSVDVIRFNVNCVLGKPTTYCGLVVLPSKIKEGFKISIYSKPLEEHIVELAPVESAMSDELLYSLLYRWDCVQKYLEGQIVKVIIILLSHLKHFQTKKMANPTAHLNELKEKYLPKMRREGKPTFQDMIVGYLLLTPPNEGERPIKVRTHEFAKAITAEYKHLMLKSPGKPRCVQPVSPDFFAPDLEGDQDYLVQSFSSIFVYVFRFTFVRLDSSILPTVKNKRCCSNYAKIRVLFLLSKREKKIIS
jgi:hypothetical protein